MGVKTRALQSCVERVQSRRHLPVSFAISQLLDFGYLDDAALAVNLRGDDTDAAEDRTLPEALRQNVDVTHPVEDWKDHRVRPYCRSEVVDRRVQSVGFDAQEDEVIRPIDFPGADQFRGEEHVTMRADDGQPFATELLGPDRADEEGNVAASLGESGAKVTADRPSANN